MPMSFRSPNPGKPGTTAPPVASEKTRIEVFLPSSSESYSERQDVDSLPESTESRTVNAQGHRDAPSPVDGREFPVKPTMAHPLYQPGRRAEDDPPKLKTRFAKFSKPGMDAELAATPGTLSAAPGHGSKSTGLPSEIDGLPGPGIGRSAKFLSSYSHNYGQNEGGKTWWSAK
ncbi:uncharacterized protein LOC119729181 [Patiria miniata]|uniref:Uncharacterized protein n=1 Tax=Patiria miniata TaxID=46514 RepID=A0A914A1A4_PATMI|nr:uncharacterized protein LOC119729181 [Patiria miniata]